MPIDKSAFLLGIGSLKYSNFKRLCKSENILIQNRSKIAFINKANHFNTGPTTSSRHSKKAQYACTLGTVRMYVGATTIAFGCF